ncbi:TetR/AcrR family transcriptional regulator [Acinetobacter gyllenbergii]|uniref:TetR/AcrR family transcriptional regulator n=1 Tax=Acinetobacter gyllenbergii TaxID=134534 RepID=UPI001E2BC62D|nr:TetR/AcrR family transcriptional regulator [Acinetobacter gyllenbergii]
MSQDETRAKQHRRLVKAAISVFAEKGYVPTTIADIVKHARVSRQVFYTLFETKEDCFLAAEELGRQALLQNAFQYFQQVDFKNDNWIRLPLRAYLNLCMQEQEFTIAWALEFPHAGPRCLRQRNAFFSELAEMLKRGHLKIQQHQPTHWKEVPEVFYQAAIGGAYEIVYRCICEQRFADLPQLEEPLVQFIKTVLGYQP